VSLRCYILCFHKPPCERPDPWGQCHLYGLRDLVAFALRRNPLSSPHKHVPSFPTCYLMPRRCTSPRITSTPPRHRSLCGCARRKLQRPVRSAPHRRIASIVTMSAPWPTCPGRRIAYAASCVSASGFAVIATATAISSPNGYPPSPPPGHGARSGSPSASSLLAWRWVVQLGCASATRGTWP
jgi:hypothetical protein